MVEVDDRASAGAAAARIDGALAYDDVIASHEPAPRKARDLDDVYMLYTGGTTGMPKGVMYGMGEFTRAWLEFAAGNLGLEPWTSDDALADWVAEQAAAGRDARGPAPARRSCTAPACGSGR